MNDVVSFETARRKKTISEPSAFGPQDILVCPECHCGLWWVYALGNMECVNCGQEVDDSAPSDTTA